VSYFSFFIAPRVENSKTYRRRLKEVFLCDFDIPLRKIFAAHNLAPVRRFKM